MDALHKSGRGRLHQSNLTLEHHYRLDIFYGTVDSILSEMNHRFNENVVELLRLSSALDPRDGYKSFNIEDICKLVEKFYPDDFSSQEKLHFKYQLELFELDCRSNVHFQNISSLSQLCQILLEIGKAKTDNLMDRLIRLVLTLPVSTATTESAFSATKIVNTRLRNKMEDFFVSSLLMYIENKIAEIFSSESIIDDFDSMKTRRVQLSMPKSAK